MVTIEETDEDKQTVGVVVKMEPRNIKSRAYHSAQSLARHQGVKVAREAGRAAYRQAALEIARKHRA